MNLPGQTEAGSARDAPMSVVLIDRCSAALEFFSSRAVQCEEKGHRTIDPHALKNLRPARGGIYPGRERRFSISR